MAIGNIEAGFPVLLTSSGQVAGGTAMASGYQGGGNDPGNTAETTVTQGVILGFYVNSTSSGTIVLRNGTTSGATAVTGTITPAIGWNYLPMICDQGIYATIGATLNVTFIVVE